MTLARALAEGQTRLASAGIKRPRLDALLLLAHALGIRREQIYQRLDHDINDMRDMKNMEGGSLPPDESLRLSLPPSAGDTPATPPDERLRLSSSRYENYIRRRADGECTAYITGIKEFRGLEFSVGPAVLVPRPDTETLVEAALECAGLPGETGAPLPVLDLCTGSGAVALALYAERPGVEVWASDISEEALKLAEANAARLFGAPETVRFFLGDLYAALPGKRFSLITANAPYVPSGAITGLSREVQKEPKIALDGGKDGLDIIRRIITGAPERLVPGAFLLLEADPSQMPETARLLEQSGFTAVQTTKDLAGRERVIRGRLP